MKYAVLNLSLPTEHKLKTGQHGLITPPSGRGLVLPGFFHYFPFFWWSLAPDLRFSLGQTNTCRVFRYTV